MTPDEITLANADGKLAIEAINAKKTFSAYLEEIDPSVRYRDEKYNMPTLDAFGRQCANNDIVTRSNPEAGIYTSTWGDFLDKNRGLALEWVFRKVREAQHFVKTPTVHLEAYTSADDPMGGIFRTFQDASGYRASRVSPQITLDQLVSVTTSINGDAYRAAFMDEPDPLQMSESRVTEFGNFPTVKISQGEHTVRIYKYGIAYLMSYEAMRRANLDKLEFWINRSVLQKNNDKVAQALDTLTQGDGNSNGAFVDTLTSLDPAAIVPGITYLGWLGFKEQFGDNYTMDLAVMRKNVKLDLLTMDTGTGNNMASEVDATGRVTETNGQLGTDVRIVSYSSANANTILGIDTSVGLEHVVEAGADLQEQVRFVENQSQKIVISEVEGFAVLDRQGARILDLTT
jgi:hypothetical protein